jgi:hypothetical protein
MTGVIHGLLLAHLTGFFWHPERNSAAFGTGFFWRIPIVSTYSFPVVVLHRLWMTPSSWTLEPQAEPKRRSAYGLTTHSLLPGAAACRLRRPPRRRRSLPPIKSGFAHNFSFSKKGLSALNCPIGYRLAHSLKAAALRLRRLRRWPSASLDLASLFAGAARGRSAPKGRPVFSGLTKGTRLFYTLHMGKNVEDTAILIHSVLEDNSTIIKYIKLPVFSFHWAKTHLAVTVIEKKH